MPGHPLARGLAELALLARRVPAEGFVHGPRLTSAAALPETARLAAVELLAGFQSILASMQAVMHPITALLAMAQRQPEPRPC